MEKLINMERTVPAQALKKYNDEGLTVIIPLPEYRDMLVTLTTQHHEILDRQFEIARLNEKVLQANNAMAAAEAKYEELKDHYTDLEAWLSDSSYYSDIFESWCKKRHEKNTKFSNDDVISRIDPPSRKDPVDLYKDEPGEDDDEAGCR